MKKYLKHLAKKADEKIIRLFSKSKYLSGVYYSFLNSSFRREHQSVLLGRIKHIDNIANKSGNHYQLVRNIHRIEKGLLMKPRRPIFAKNYIEETIDLYSIEWHKSNTHDTQVKWFHDVLSEYFESCATDEIIDKQSEKFYSLLKNENKIYGETKSKKPYSRQTVNLSDITFDKFYQLTKQRRSVRWFSDKEVPRKLIDKAILAANQSPSACNRQPFEYRIIDDPGMLKKVVNIPMGTKGYANNIPVMVICIGNLDAYFSERDRHLIYIDASLANMSLMLALETLGLASCPINWPDIEEKENQMANFLGLESYQRPIMCIGLGYADPEGMIAFSEKRSILNIRKYN